VARGMNFFRCLSAPCCQGENIDDLTLDTVDQALGLSTMPCFSPRSEKVTETKVRGTLVAKQNSAEENADSENFDEIGPDEFHDAAPRPPLTQIPSMLLNTPCRGDEPEAAEKISFESMHIKSMDKPLSPSWWEFKAIIDRSKDKKLGIGVNPDITHTATVMKALKVVVVQKGSGAVAIWNQEHPEYALVEGDVIIEVNGKSGNIQEMVDECMKTELLDLTLRRKIA